MIPLLVISFFIAIIIIGFSSNKNNSISDYLYSGRKLTVPSLIATLVTTWYGGINEIGNQTINHGIVVWLYFGICYYIAAILYAYFIAPRVIDKNYRSIPITIYESYGKIPGLISLITILLFLIPAPYLLMLGQLISEIFSINQTEAIILGLIFSTAYTLKGGFSSIIKTDRIQFIFMFFGFMMLSGFLFFSDQYGIGLIQNLYQRESHLFQIPGNMEWSLIIAYSSLALITFLDPSFHQRTFAGKNLKTVQKSIVLSVICWFIFDLITISSALFYLEITFINGNIIDTASPYIALAKDVFQNYPFLMGIFFISILSVVMSTIDSYTFLSSMTLRYDLNTIIGRKTNIQTIRDTIVIILIISFILSTFFDNALDYWYYFGTYVIVSTLFPLICTLFDIKIKSVTLMMITSVSATLFWDLSGITLAPSIYIGLSINLLILLYQIIVNNHNNHNNHNHN